MPVNLDDIERQRKIYFDKQVGDYFKKQAVYEFNYDYYKGIPLKTILDIKRGKNVEVILSHNNGRYGFLLRFTGENIFSISKPNYFSEDETLKEADLVVEELRNSIKIH